jgi:hypothetical protein
MVGITEFVTFPASSSIRQHYNDDIDGWSSSIFVFMAAAMTYLVNCDA